MQNYDFIAASRLKYGFLLDINANESLFHHLIQNSILSSENAILFLESLSRKMHQIGWESEKIIRAIFEAKPLWLQRSDYYNYIRQMFLSNHIVILTCNIANPVFANTMLRCCRRKHISIDTFYISNIADWLIFAPDEIRALQENITKLIQEYPSLRMIDVESEYKIVNCQMIRTRRLLKISQGLDFTILTQARRELLSPFSSLPSKKIIPEDLQELLITQIPIGFEELAEINTKI